MKGSLYLLYLYWREAGWQDRKVSPGSNASGGTTFAYKYPSVTNWIRIEKGGEGDRGRVNLTILYKRIIQCKNCPPGWTAMILTFFDKMEHTVTSRIWMQNGILRHINGRLFSFFLIKFVLFWLQSLQTVLIWGPGFFLLEFTPCINKNAEVGANFESVKTMANSSAFFEIQIFHMA